MFVRRTARATAWNIGAARWPLAASFHPNSNCPNRQCSATGTSSSPCSTRCSANRSWWPNTSYQNSRLPSTCPNTPRSNSPLCPPPSMPSECLRSGCSFHATRMFLILDRFLCYFPSLVHFYLFTLWHNSISSLLFLNSLRRPRRLFLGGYIRPGHSVRRSSTRHQYDSYTAPRLVLSQVRLHTHCSPPPSVPFARTRGFNLILYVHITLLSFLFAVQLTSRFLSHSISYLQTTFVSRILL